jgi:ABC-type lipoprotein release transport system permease subunit
MRALLILVLVACKSKSPARELVLSMTPHVIVLKSSATFAEYRDVMAEAKKLDPEGVTGAAPMTTAETLASTATAKLVPVILKGDEPTTLTRRYTLTIASGSLAELGTPGDPAPIVLGQGLATKLGVAVGGSVELAIDAERRPVDFEHPTPATAPLTKRFRVIAIFQQPDLEYDLHVAYATMGAVQAMAERGDHANAVGIWLTDPDRADAFAERLTVRLGGPPYHAQSWNELNKETLER